MKRKIYNDLLKWKNQGMKKPLIVVGARQVGKTYIIKEFCEKEFESYIYFNLFDNVDFIELFKTNSSIEDKISILKILIRNKYNIDINFNNTLIFVDEVQESEEFISSLKYFAESKNKYNIIVAGSLLGVKLKRMKKAFPVGKVDMLTLNPMDFEEVILETLGEDTINNIKKCYNDNTPINSQLHNMLLDLYKKYICIGGMPEIVQNFVDNNKDMSKFEPKDLENIKIGYLNDMRKYVKDPTETVRIENIYNSIAIQIGNKSNKFQYSKINKTARSINYESAMQWLVSSKMIEKIDFVSAPTKPLELHKDDTYFKLYINDIGLLRLISKIDILDILNDVPFTEKGILSENYVLQQLISNNLDVYYWKDENYIEIDFLISNNDGVIPIEVKSNDRVRSSSLNKYIKMYSPKYSIRVSSKNFGFESFLH